MNKAKKPAHERAVGAALSIEGEQLDISGEKSSITLSVIGRRFLRGKGIYITYEDDSIIEGLVIPTVLKIEQDEVMLKRSGPIRSVQHFARGLKYKSIYETPYGSFNIMTQTTRFWVRLPLDGDYSHGSVELAFNIEFDGKKQSENQLKISWENEEEAYCR